jgi:hypothetical protein
MSGQSLRYRVFANAAGNTLLLAAVAIPLPAGGDEGTAEPGVGILPM